MPMVMSLTLLYVQNYGLSRLTSRIHAEGFQSTCQNLQQTALILMKILTKPFEDFDKLELKNFCMKIMIILLYLCC